MKRLARSQYCTDFTTSYSAHAAAPSAHSPRLPFPTSSLSSTPYGLSSLANRWQYGSQDFRWLSSSPVGMSNSCFKSLDERRAVLGRLVLFRQCRRHVYRTCLRHTFFSCECNLLGVKLYVKPKKLGRDSTADSRCHLLRTYCRCVSERSAVTTMTMTEAMNKRFPVWDLLQFFCFVLFVLRVIMFFL